MPDLPSGTVTFLFTDVEGSTRLLKQLRDRYAELLADHQRLLREASASTAAARRTRRGIPSLSSSRAPETPFSRPPRRSGPSSSTNGRTAPLRGCAHRRADRGRELWAQNDRRIVDQAPWVPLYNTRSADFVSERVGNYQHHPQWGVLVDQLWVR